MCIIMSQSIEKLAKQYRYLKTIFASPPRTLVSWRHVNNRYNVSDLLKHENIRNLLSEANSFKEERLTAVISHVLH